MPCQTFFHVGESITGYTKNRIIDIGWEGVESDLSFDVGAGRTAQNIAISEPMVRIEACP